jgi:fatty-acyl-CoA synthase
VSTDALHQRRVAAPSDAERDSGRATRVTSTGRPMPGVRVRIDGPGEVGEILVRSPSLATGYLEDPARSARTFAGGELRTGDLGFMRDGELYVIGRDDDMMSIGGRNLNASEVESRLCQDHPLRAGGCVLVDVHDRGRKRLVVVAEPESEELDFTAMARAMRTTAASSSGISVHECVFLPRGSLPKSPSGKVQRFRCRQIVSDRGPSLARVPVG